jgi:hypothetical protein
VVSPDIAELDLARQLIDVARRDRRRAAAAAAFVVRESFTVPSIATPVECTLDVFGYTALPTIACDAPPNRITARRAAA